MNRISFLYKFIFKQSGGRYNWNLLFPFLGVIIGCVTVALTLAIMEGMEYEIYNKLKNVSFPAKLNHIPGESKIEVEKYLMNYEIDYEVGVEDQVLLIKDGDFKYITIHGISEFMAFRDKVFSDNLQEIYLNTHLPVIYLGTPLALKLNISLGDTVKISTPKQINFFTGLPPIQSVIVGGIFNLKILDYDLKHIFTHSSSVMDFLPSNRILYHLYEIPGEEFSKSIAHSFPGLYLSTWEDEHQSFVSAMKLEKIAYSVIGFFIVGIAGFTLMSMMSLSVIQRVSQIGILRAMGAKKQNIGVIFIIQALGTWFVSSTIGIMLSLLIIEIDKHYHLKQILFPSAIFFDFPLILQYEYILLIMSISLLLLLSAALYPSIKAAKLGVIKSIGFR